MSNSALDKLPLKFVATCVFGIALAGFLLTMRTGNSDSSEVATDVATLDTEAKAQDADLSEPESRDVIAELADGESDRIVSSAGSQVANKVSASAVIASSNTDVVADSKTRVAQAVESEFDETPSVVRLSKPEKTLIKSETVAARVDPFGGSRKYSQESPDPSDALSEALDEELAPDDIVMPETEMPIPLLPDDEAGKVDGELTTEETTEAEAGDRDVAKATVPAEPKPEQEEPSVSEEQSGDSQSAEPGQEVAPESVVSGELTPGDTPDPEITIQNPSFNRLPVWFVINQKKIRLEPGQKFVFSGAASIPLRFSRGGSFGVSQVTVSDGVWRFSVNREQGWKLEELVR